MTQKHFSTNSKITALVLSLLLIIGMIPLQVSAAEPTHDTILMEGINPTAEVKVAQFPNSSTQLMLLTCDSGETPTFARELYYSISRDGLSYSRPTRVKSDLTNDLYPFIYTPTGSSSQNDLIFTWTDADKVFDTDITPEGAANSMRISIAVMNSESLSFSVEPYTFSVHESNDVCHYKSRITNIDGKILVTWVVCSDIKQNEGSFSVVGMYYNPATNTFSTNDNQKDESGKLIPMTFVDGRNYISEYSVAKLAGGIAVLFEEDTDGKRITDEIYSCTTDNRYNYPYDFKETNKNTELNLAVSGKVTNLAPSGGYGSVVESAMPYLSYYYNNNLYNISDYSASPDGWRTESVFDVSETGNTRYSFITKNSTVEYIAAREDTPIKTDKTEINFRGKKYTKSADGKWLDDDGNSCYIYQENIRLYYREPTENEPVLLPLGLIDKDEFVFTSSPMPSFFIDDSDRLNSVWITGYKNFERAGATLSSVIYSRENLLKANYKAVKEAITRANALNQSDYSNYSNVTDAINAVVYDKGYKEQSTVNAYATAIENAIDSLTLRGADYTEVDAAIAKANAINADLYKNYADVTAAVNAVDRSKNFKQQADVDLMANAINDAIAALEYKDADYSRVDAAIAKANSLDRNDYKDFTAVDVAVAAVVRDKNITEQSEVDAMATAIFNAVSDLEYKDTNNNTENKDKDNKKSAPAPSTDYKKSPQTGTADTMLWAALLLISGGIITTATSHAKRKKRLKVNK